ncbi:MAG: HutD family protein [Comamonadaceae bacterium]
MSWQTVRLADVLPSPWRNGGGVTRELAAWPIPHDWIWRMSVAEVARSGPFSRFDGVQRWFAVLGGAGVRLTLGGHAHELTRDSEPLCFDGASAVECQLLDGATQDFNLMLHADKAAAQMKRISGTVNMVLDAPKTVAVYAAGEGTQVLCEQDSFELAAHSLAWQALPAGSTVQLKTEGALWMEIDP